MSKTIEYKYKPADKYLVLNDGDPDLKPIVLSLPDPPPIHLIDGYGKAPEDQRFERLTLPVRLQQLENRIIDDLKTENASSKNYVITLYKIQKRFWEELEKHASDYKLETAFIRKIWWHRINGYWFFNFGKPTYITGWHFMYLNFWTMSTDNGSNRPDYRDRDRKEFLFMNYQYTTTETFKHLDEEGYAIPNEDGTYEMRDLNRRLIYGGIQPKNRRSGNTNKALNNAFEIISRTMNGEAGMGIMSDSGQGAEEHLRTKLTPAYRSWPLWLKPVTRTINNDEIIFDIEKNDYDVKSLQTKVSAATSENPKFYDSKKLYSGILDEQGKATEVLSRWNIIKHCLSQGNGSRIHGYCYLPSTVEDVSDGASDFEYLCNQSNFYKRLTTGGTVSGLLRLFIPASEGLDGFIDSYGYSVKDYILPHQEREGFKQTALEYLQAERDSYLKEGTVTALETLRKIKKKFPLQYSDSFLGDAGDIGFNYDKIDQRLAELRRVKHTKIGNFYWVNDIPFGDVYFKEEVDGRFEIAWEPPNELRNKKSTTIQYSVIEDDDVEMYMPFGSINVVIGVDPFRWSNKREANLKSLRTGNKSRLSDGGIAGYLLPDTASEGLKRREERESDRFVFTYRNRTKNDTFNEDVVMAAIFYRAMVYLENNVETTWRYFITHNFGGYLIYDIDPLSGRIKEKPGVFTLESSKTRLFTSLRDYIEYRCHKEEFASFLQECKDIRGTEEMRSFDRLTAHGLSLMGAESLMLSYVNHKQDEENGYQMDDFLEYWEL